jgi:hypothetical protein
MRAVFLIILFFLLGAFFIISNENIHINKKAEFSNLYSLYYNWLSNIFSNAKSISGYIVKFNWLPDTNQTSNNP